MANEIGTWITRRFLEWQLKQGGKRTASDFAAYLGVSRDTLNNWLGGRRRPRGASVTLLADKLGPELYDLLGLARPFVDPDLRLLSRLWDQLTPEQRSQVVELAKSLAGQA